MSRAKNLWVARGRPLGRFQNIKSGRSRKTTMSREKDKSGHLRKATMSRMEDYNVTLIVRERTLCHARKTTMSLVEDYHVTREKLPCYAQKTTRSRVKDQIRLLAKDDHVMRKIPQYHVRNTS